MKVSADRRAFASRGIPAVLHMDNFIGFHESRGIPAVPHMDQFTGTHDTLCPFGELGDTYAPSCSEHYMTHESELHMDHVTLLAPMEV